MTKRHLNFIMVITIAAGTTTLLAILLLFLYKNVWILLEEAERVATLKTEVASVTLKRGLIEDVLKHLEEKQKQTFDIANLRDPFAPLP